MGAGKEGVMGTERKGLWEQMNAYKLEPSLGMLVKSM